MELLVDESDEEKVVCWRSIVDFLYTQIHHRAFFPRSLVNTDKSVSRILPNGLNRLVATPYHSCSAYSIRERFFGRGVLFRER